MQIKLCSLSLSELLPRHLNHRRFKTKRKIQSQNCHASRLPFTVYFFIFTCESLRDQPHPTSTWQFTL